MELQVYFDYLCPYVHQAAVLLRRVREAEDVRVDWRYFSLRQVNRADGDPDVWDAPAAERISGRDAFRAAEAARRQGRFEPFHDRLLAARHEERRNIDDVAVLEDAAGSAGLDVRRWREDMADPHILRSLERDHTEAVRRYGAFGTPTFVVPGGGAAYVRMRPAPEGQEAKRFFRDLLAAITDRPYLLEVKRPVPPKS
ncbi:MAG: DsbA family protein [Nocardiopsaceae bacterium]|jgi:predicted DsbA family dithiol-disulfide isomerase|nr:DsbA family protein [Nocardiopsaceae bacterium]